MFLSLAPLYIPVSELTWGTQTLVPCLRRPQVGSLGGSCPSEGAWGMVGDLGLSSLWLETCFIQLPCVHNFQISLFFFKTLVMFLLKNSVLFGSD